MYDHSDSGDSNSSLRDHHPQQHPQQQQQQQQSNVGLSSPLDKYQRFESWLKENGAQFDLLELREYDEGHEKSLEENVAEEKKEQQPSGSDFQQGHIPNEQNDSEMRGVHANVSLPSNTVCMSVPRRCLITVEMGQDTPIGQAVLSSDLDLDAPKHIFLMIYLLWDRKVNRCNSFFHPYYEILPQTLSNMPIFLETGGARLFERKLFTRTNR